MSSVNIRKIGTAVCAMALAVLIPAGGWLYAQKSADERAAQIVARRRNAERIWSAKEEADLLANEQSATEKMLTERQMKVLSAIKETLSGIVCWGDSITAGVGGQGTTYAVQLQSLLQTDMATRFQAFYPVDFVTTKPYRLVVPVSNMGVAGESSLTVVGRNGAIPYVMTEDVTIPADINTSVRIRFTSQDGTVVEPMIQGTRGIGSVTIGGVQGTLTVRQVYGEESRYAYFFNRFEEGESVTVPTGTVVETEGSGAYKDYLAVIQLGNYGGYEDADDLIRQIKAIAQGQNNPERYIVLGVTVGDRAHVEEMNSALAAEFGDRFIDIWQYMSDQGMKDAGLELTFDDVKAIEAGLLPISLTDGSSAFNATGYRLIAECIYRKIYELGYMDAINASLDISE